MSEIKDLANTSIKFTFATGDVITMPFVAAWSIYHTDNYEAVFEIMLLGAQTANKQLNTDGTMREKIEEELLTLAEMLFVNLKQNHPTREDMLCLFSYQLLRAQQTTWTQVAQLASYLLGRTVEAEAWRKRVIKYAKDKGHDKLNLPKGRPKKKPEN